MANPQKSSQALLITLWIVQLLLASTLAWASCMKLFQPIEQLSTMWPWAGEVPAAFVKFTGVVDLIGAIGLVLPALLRVKPVLTPIAAIAVIVLMICASVFHIARGEASVIGVNVVFAVMAAFVAWGRFVKAPIASK